MATKEPQYNKRVWLNLPTSSFTGFMVCFSRKTDAFFRLGDCNTITNIHMEYDYTDPEKSRLKYIKKITLIRDELNKYIDFLNTKFVEK
jgi:hypothetical protein